MTPPTPPPEIEAAIVRVVRVATRDGVAIDASNVLTAKPSATTNSACATLRTAITSALAAAREAGRRDVLEGAAGVEEAIADYTEAAIMARPHASGHVLTAAGDDLRAAIAAALEAL